MKENFSEYDSEFAEAEVKALATLFRHLYRHLANPRSREGHTYGCIADSSGMFRLDVLFGLEVPETSNGIFRMGPPFDAELAEAARALIAKKKGKPQNQDAKPTCYVRFGSSGPHSDESSLRLLMNTMPGMGVVEECFLDLAGDPWPGDEDAILCPFGLLGKLKLEELEGAEEVLVQRFNLHGGVR